MSSNRGMNRDRVADYAKLIDQRTRQLKEYLTRGNAEMVRRCLDDIQDFVEKAYAETLPD